MKKNTTLVVPEHNQRTTTTLCKGVCLTEFYRLYKSIKTFGLQTLVPYPSWHEVHVSEIPS